MKKKSSPWPFIAGGVVLVICLAVVALAFRGAGRFGLLNNSSGATTVPQPPVELPTQPATEAAPVTPSLLPPVATAAADATRMPDDPAGGLELSLAYWDAGQIRPALITLSRAADLAGSDTKFFMEAGSKFKGRQAWIAAAAMYLRAIKSLGPAGKPSEELELDYHEALYKASIQPDFFSFLPFNDLSRVEQPIAMVAQARNLYYNGQTDRAHQTLNQLETIKPHMPEATLLQAEMDAQEGNAPDAKKILNILLSNLDTPDWVREEALNLSNKIP